eukprot:scaffold44142_cov35-Tisochrysis_lutea.AAC.3
MASTGSEQVATIALRSMQGVLLRPPPPTVWETLPLPPQEHLDHVACGRAALSCPPHGGNLYHQCTQHGGMGGHFTTA